MSTTAETAVSVGLPFEATPPSGEPAARARAPKASLSVLDVHGASDRGQLRDVNEDRFVVARLERAMRVHATNLDGPLDRDLEEPQATLLAVADGVGGDAAGAVASAAALDALAQYVMRGMPWYLRHDPERDDDVLDELELALCQCHTRLAELAARGGGAPRMYTTLTIAYLLGRMLYVAHVGDSRCYLLRAGQLRQVTTDHALARQLVDRDLMSPGDAEAAQLGHVLVNAVGGGSAELAPEMHRIELRPGDTLLVCSDGLTRHVPDAALRDLLAGRRSAEDCCRRLVDGANRAGGRDNITVIVARLCPGLDRASATEVDHGDATERRHRP
jgi:protein phosphatase